jgi:hypothetical protein
MNLEVRILNELWVRFAELRILMDLAFWAWLIEGDGGGAVCRWMKALGVRCGRLLGPRKEAYFGRLRFRIHTR